MSRQKGKADIQTQVNEVNRISYGTVYKGSIRAESDIRVDGLFEGEIFTTGKVVVGESAKVLGRVAAQNCDVWGSLEGELLVKEYFGLRKSGSFKGEVSCQKIFIEEEGLFNGSCKIIDDNQFAEGAKEFIEE